MSLRILGLCLVSLVMVSSGCYEGCCACKSGEKTETAAPATTDAPAPASESK